jgi:hypothetical protein
MTIFIDIILKQTCDSPRIKEKSADFLAKSFTMFIFSKAYLAISLTCTKLNSDIIFNINTIKSPSVFIS